MGCIVSDMAAMDNFLAKILGAKPFVTDDRIHRYDVGASQVKFWQVNGDLPAWVGGPMEKTGMNLIQFIVPDVDAVREEVVARGGKIAREPFPLGQLATIMFVEGPDGILFEFAGPLAARFRQDR
jgi:predicted enzyme related to lactoylglutathione lyase